jgi:hypothetical protein
MAKKKNDRIMEQLHALKANVPTNSRQTETTKIKPATAKSTATKPTTVKPPEVKPPVAAKQPSAPAARPSVMPEPRPAAIKESSSPAAAFKPAVEPTVELPAAPLPVKLPEPEITVKDFGPGFMEIMIKNIDSMARARDVLAGEMGRINAIIINTMQHSMLLSFDMYKINSNYIVELLKTVLVPHGSPKDKD